MFKIVVVAGIVALSLVSSGLEAQTLVVCTEASPDSLNAGLSTANTSFDVTEQIGDRLLEMEVGGSSLRPGLAESWTVSDDGLRYTFKLRHGVKFQSTAAFKPSRDFNADDVLFTMNRMFDPEARYSKVGGGTYEMFAAFIKPSLKSIAKSGDDTVILELKQPNAPFLSALSVPSFSIQSAEYADFLEKKGTPEQIDLAPIGTGPFQLVQYQKDSQIRFRAFRDFWGATGGAPERAAKVDNLVFSITPDASVRLARLKTNECQIARYPNPADLDALRTTPGVSVQEATIAALSTLSFRSDMKPFDDARVRRALSMAIDLPNLIKAVFQGTGTPAAAIVPPSLWGHDSDLKPYPYDPVKAKALLAEAGYHNGFSTDLWSIPVVRAYMPNGRRAGEMIQADWAKIGVTAKIVTFEWGEYLRRIKVDQYGVGMSGGTWDFPDPSQLTNSFTCEAVAIGRNVPHWCNRAFSDLLAQALVITDRDARAKLYIKAQEIFHEEAPAMLFADVKAFVGVRNSVKGFKLHFLGGQPFGGVSLSP